MPVDFENKRRWKMSDFSSGVGKKKNPAEMPCVNSSLERLRNKWNRSSGFRRPIKACRPPHELRSRFLCFTVQGLCFFTRTWQGQVSVKRKARELYHLPTQSHTIASPHSLFDRPQSAVNILFKDHSGLRPLAVFSIVQTRL